MKIDTDKLIVACDQIAQHCITIGGKRHGAPWLYNELMTVFESAPACDSITIAVYYNAPVMAAGTATIGRNGHVTYKLDK